MKKIKKFLLNIAKKHHWFMRLIRVVRSLSYKIRYGIYYLSNNVDENMIVFEVFAGKKYADSPKAIYEYMLRDINYKDYKYYWFFEDPSKYKFLEKHRNTKVYKYKSKMYFKLYAKSKYWITNSTIPEIIRKKPSQRYIQTWHGTPLKRLGYDILVEGNAMNNLKDIRDKWKKTASLCDYLISPSKFVSDKYKSAFNLEEINKNVKIIEKGYPRNDFLSNYKGTDVNNIKKKLNIPKEKKIILYAPTWRDNAHNSEVGYVYENKLNFDNLRDKLSDEYVILFRVHYLIANSFNFEKYNGFIFDVSNYDDINDLYIISDLLITDYSSVFFDYSILKRPMIFYMYDLDEYKNNMRDFYIDLKELPGKIVEEEEDLVKEIAKTDKFSYSEKYKKFNAKYTYLDDGNASMRVVKEIFK